MNQSAKPDLRRLAAPNRVDLARLVDRVTHAFQTSAGADAPSVEARHYSARLTSQGVQVSPGPPANASAASPGEARGAAPWQAQFSTISFRLPGQESETLAAQARDWTVQGNTAQALLDPATGLVEHWEALEAGLALTWVLGQRPPNEGDFALATEVTGLDYVAQTASGLHFGDANGKARLRLGAITLVDATGRTWDASWEVVGQACQLTVPASVLEQATFPLAIDPLISPEFGVDQPLAGLSPGTQAAPAIARGSQGYLLVWTQGRSEVTDPGLYAARLSPEGALLDPFGFVVSSNAGEQTVTAVAAVGDQCLVVWSGPRGSSTTEWDIYGARVGPGRQVLDSTPLTVCGAAGVQATPAVAANETDYLVVWRDSRGTGIYGTLVSTAGRVATTNGFPICTAANDQFTPAVAALGQDFLVVWQDYRSGTLNRFVSDIYGARVSGAGVVLDATGIPISTRPESQSAPAVSANGELYLVVWEDYNAQGNDICGARVSREGAVLDADGLAISTAPNLQSAPAVAAGQRNFLVTWQDFRNSATNRYEADLYGTLVQTDGTVAEPDGVAITTAPDNQWFPAIVGGDEGFLVVWQDARDYPSASLAEVYGTRVDGQGRRLGAEDLALSRPANAEVAPAVAVLGEQSLVVWADSRNSSRSGYDIYGARLSRTGDLLDLAAIPICTAAHHQLTPAVAADHLNYLVTWADWRLTNQADIYGARLNPQGVVLDPDGLPLCTAPYDQTAPAVASLGADFLVLWQDARNSLTNAVRYDIYAARVGADGRLLDPAGVSVCTNTAHQTAPAVAASDTQFLAVWEDRRSSSTPDIFGTRLDAAGEVLDRGGILIAQEAYDLLAPSAAALGSDYLVAWTSMRPTSGTGPDIYGARLNGAGRVLDAPPLAIRVAPNAQSAPAIVATPNGYIVVWQEARSGSTNDFDLVGGLMDRQGQLLDNTAVLSATPRNQTLPALIHTAPGRFLLVQQTFDDLAPRLAASLFALEPSASLPAAQLEAPTRSTDPFAFVLRGEAGRRYSLLVSSDLTTWTYLRTLVNTNGADHVTDGTATNSPQRFYRAVTLP